MKPKYKRKTPPLSIPVWVTGQELLPDGVEWENVLVLCSAVWHFFKPPTPPPTRLWLRFTRHATKHAYRFEAFGCGVTVYTSDGCSEFRRLAETEAERFAELYAQGYRHFSLEYTQREN